MNWSIHVLNISPTFSVQNMTPEEAWHGRKPAVDHFRIFGCIAYAHVPDEKRKKLDDKGEKCVFLGIREVSKAYKLFNPLTKKIITSKDVIFDEQNTWNWSKNCSRQQLLPVFFDGENEEERQQQPLQQQIPIANVPENEPTPSAAETSPTAADSTDAVAKSRLRRVQKRLGWMTDFEVPKIDQYEDPLTYFTLFSDCDPTIFEDAVKESKWQKAIDDEVAAIVWNNT